MSRSIGNIPPEVPELGNDISFDQPTTLDPAEDVRAGATCLELSNDPSLTIGSRIVGAVQAEYGSDAASTSTVSESNER